jgi:hypothetical protein
MGGNYVRVSHRLGERSHLLELCPRYVALPSFMSHLMEGFLSRMNMCGLGEKPHSKKLLTLLFWALKRRFLRSITLSTLRSGT